MLRGGDCFFCGGCRDGVGFYHQVLEGPLPPTFKCFLNLFPFFNFSQTNYRPAFFSIFIYFSQIIDYL